MIFNNLSVYLMKKIYLSTLLVVLSLSVFGQAPTISVSANTPDTVCAGTAVTYTAIATNPGSTPLYVWSINGVITSGGPNFTYVPANGDRVNCSILSSSPTAIPDTASAGLVMTVNPVIVPSVAISTGMGDTVCAGSTTHFTAVPTGGGLAPTYQWWKNYVPVGTGAAYSYAPANGDIKSCKMVSNYTCRSGDTALTTIVITVSPMLTPSVNILTSTGSAISCVGMPVTYYAASSAGGWSPSYQWKVNGTIVGTNADTFTYVPNSGDAVSVRMTSSFPCLMTPVANQNLIMTVQPIEAPVVVVAAHPGFMIPTTINDTFVCTVVSGGGAAPAYQWFKNGVLISAATNSTWIATAGSLASGDSIACNVTNTDGCSQVTSFASLRIVIGNLSVGNTSSEIPTLTIVPNPNNGVFTLAGNIGYSSNEPINMEITDMVGRVVYAGQLTSVNGRIEDKVLTGSTLANGMYLLNIHTAHISQVLHFAVAK